MATSGDSLAKWTMEFPGGVAPGIGIPQSQIMDTGLWKCVAPVTKRCIMIGYRGLVPMAD